MNNTEFRSYLPVLLQATALVSCIYVSLIVTAPSFVEDGGCRPGSLENIVDIYRMPDSKAGCPGNLELTTKLASQVIWSSRHRSARPPPTAGK